MFPGTKFINRKNSQELKTNLNIFLLIGGAFEVFFMEMLQCPVYERNIMIKLRNCKKLFQVSPRIFLGHKILIFNKCNIKYVNCHL